MGGGEQLSRPNRVLRILALSGDPEGLIRRAQLGPTQEAVVRGLLEGRSLREIAQAKGVSHPRVYEALGQALKRLEAVMPLRT